MGGFQSSCLVGTRSTKRTVLGIVAHHQYLYHVDGLVAPQRDIDIKKEESTTTRDKPALPATGEVLGTATIATETKRRQTVLAVGSSRCYQSMAPPTASHNFQVMVETSLVPFVPSLEETQFRPFLLCLKDATRPLKTVIFD